MTELQRLTDAECDATAERVGIEKVRTRLAREFGDQPGFMGRLNDLIDEVVTEYPASVYGDITGIVDPDGRPTDG